MKTLLILSLLALGGCAAGGPNSATTSYYNPPGYQEYPDLIHIPPAGYTGSQSERRMGVPIEPSGNAGSNTGQTQGARPSENPAQGGGAGGNTAAPR